MESALSWHASGFHRLTALQTTSGGKVGQNIYLEIICMRRIKVHNVSSTGERERLMFAAYRSIVTIGITSQNLREIMRLQGIS